MEAQVSGKSKKPVPFAASARFRIAQETSVREWHRINSQRFAEGKVPFDLAITNQALGKELGLWPLDTSGIEMAKPQAKPPAKVKAVAPAKAPASPKTPPAALQRPANASRKPNAKALADKELQDEHAEVVAKKSKAEKQQQLPLAKRTQNRAPTLEAAEQFQFAFDHFNKNLFGGTLEDTIISWEIMKKGAGVFRPDRWAKQRGLPVCHEIGINPVVHYERDVTHTLSTLVHEMCHQWVQQTGKGKVKPYHCKIWHAKMLEVGLTPIITDGNGNPLFDKNGEPKKVGKNAGHEDNPDGAFVEECKSLLATGFDLVWSRIPDPVAPKTTKAPKPKERVKHVCPKCEEYAVAKRDYTLICKPCKKVMEPDLSDDPVADAEDE